MAVTLLVASACAHPAAEAEEYGDGAGAEETTARHGLRVGLTYKKPSDYAKDCYKHGKDVLKWMKKKLEQLQPAAVTTTEVATPKTITNKPVVASGYETTDSAIDGGVVSGPLDGNGETPGEVDETSGAVDETPEAGGQIEPAAGGGDAVDNPYPIVENLSEFADQPAIDVRSTF